MRARPTEAFIWAMRSPKSLVEKDFDWVQSSGVSDTAAPRWRNLVPALLVGVAAIAGYAALVLCSRTYVWSHPAAGEPYNLVVEGFRRGHTWMAVAAPPDLVRSEHPYRFATYKRYLAPPWGLVDLSYFKGHMYAYFGVTPAVILFWPWRVLTGSSMHQAFAVLIFGTAGYALALALGLAVWRRYFPRLGPWVGAAIALTTASATTLPVFLVRPGLFEVSISCAFMLVMASLGALWKAWHGQRGKAGWLAAASVAYGLAVGARPTLLFGAAVLLVPVAAAWRTRKDRRAWAWMGFLAAAVLPITGVGLGLAAYNWARFGNPVQFGHDYQLSGNDVFGTNSFGPRFFMDDVWLLLLSPIRWHSGFPFVWRPVLPALVPGHLPVEFFFGALTNLPVLMAACFVPGVLARLPRAAALAASCCALLVLFAATALPVLFYAGTTSRYLVDFLPALALLALVGFLGMEELGLGNVGGGAVPLRVLIPPVIRAALVYSAVVSWLLALALSSFYQGAEEATQLLAAGKIDEAIPVFARVSKVNPDFQGSADLSVGMALLNAGRIPDATRFLQMSAIERPGDEQAHYALGQALVAAGDFRGSVLSFAKALSLAPADADAEANIGYAYYREGRLAQALEHERAALRLDPGQETAKSMLERLAPPEVRRAGAK
jgi:hypothetical protein